MLFTDKNSTHTHVWEERESKNILSQIQFSRSSQREWPKTISVLVFVCFALITDTVRTICCLSYYLSSYSTYIESAVESRITTTTIIKQLKQQPRRLPSKHGKSHFLALPSSLMLLCLIALFIYQRAFIVFLCNELAQHMSLTRPTTLHATTIY